MLISLSSGMWRRVAWLKYTDVQEQLLLLQWRNSRTRVSAASLLRFLFHTQLNTHALPVGLLWSIDCLVAEAATYTTHNKHKRHSCPHRGSNTRPKTYALDCTTIEIGFRKNRQPLSSMWQSIFCSEDGVSSFLFLTHSSSRLPLCEPQISYIKMTSLGIESRSSIQRHASLPVIAFHV